MDKIKVFVVDDSVVARNIMMRLLSDAEDIEIAGEAGTGQSAIMLLDKIEPDVVILESSVGGGMSIGEIIREMRDLCPKMKIILSVDFATTTEIVKYSEFGVADLVRKPYNKSSILRAVRTAAI
jgi:two-component system chemotaxis response regulator CheY